MKTDYSSINTLAKKATASLRRKGIRPVWYFKAPSVRYGIALVNGKPWQFDLDVCRMTMSGRPGMPWHPSPTKQLANGLAKALKALGI
jgi:hypothetical protein